MKRATKKRTHIIQLRLVFLIGILHLPRVVGAELTVPLTAEQVACNQAQLEKMMGRMRATAPFVNELELPTTLFLSYSQPTGMYEGLAIANEFDRHPNSPDGLPIPPPEHHLAFHFNPSVRTLLLNPERPTVGQISLNREQSSSNLVPSGRATNITMTLDPSLPGNPAPDRLEINNLEIPPPGSAYNGFLSNSTKPGRGLDTDGLLQSCHGRFTDQDRKVFLVLSRMLRLIAELVRPDLGTVDADLEVAVFRLQAEHAYGAEIGLLTPDGVLSGHILLELDVQWSSEGHLTSGTLRVLPFCTAGQDQGCTHIDHEVAIYLIPPVFPGKTRWLSLPEKIGVFLNPASPVPGPVPVDFEALLADTTWNP
jgi:hypothetical protein